MTQSHRILKLLSFPIQYLEIGESLMHARGLDVEGFYRLCGVAYTQSRPQGQTINGLQMRTALQLYLNICEPRPAPLVQLMQHFPLTVHGPLGMLAMTSATIGGALDSALEYASLIMPAFNIRRENHGQTVHVIFERRYDFGEVNELFTEIVLATFLKIRPFLVHQPSQVHIHFTHAPLSEAEDYVLGPEDVQITFNSGLNQIIVSAKDLNIPLLAPSRASRQLMQSVLKHQLVSQADTCHTTLQVKRLLQQALQDGQFIDAPKIAACLNVSGRTLSRRLKSEGATLPQLQTEVSVAFAELLLLESDKSIAEVARSTGFKDTTSFSRAFKRRTGRSPSGFRGKMSRI